MRTLFVHLSKCAGSSLRSVAEDQYGEDFHSLTPNTSMEELRTWLDKNNCFIASEVHGLSRAILSALVNEKDLSWITISRDPVSRFLSFCSYSSRVYGTKTGGVGYWGLDRDLSQSVDCNFWLRSCIESIKLALLNPHDTCLSQANPQLSFAVYSQWFVSSLFSVANQSGRLDYFGNNYAGHIYRNRKMAIELKISLRELIEARTRSLFRVKGSTSSMSAFMQDLFDAKILEPCPLPRQNVSNNASGSEAHLYELDKQIVAEFYALLPEDFYFHSA